MLMGSCNKVKDKTKQVINKSGEAVGVSATEFFDGVGTGIEETLALKVDVSSELQQKGLQTGKSYTGAKKNVLTVYLIFNQDFNETMWVKAFDKDGTEIGRADTIISSKAGKAGYFEFVFDQRTKLESRCKIKLE
jgi:hypothetical protein